MLDQQGHANPDTAPVVPVEEGYRNERRTRIGISFVTVLITGLVWISWVSQPIESPPEVVSEAVFNEIIPYHDQENLFFFQGDTSGRKDDYVFNMDSGEWKRDDGSYESISDESVHLLKEGHRLRVETDDFGRRLVLEWAHGEQSEVGRIPDSGQPLFVSPVKDAFVYIGEGQKGWNLTLFRLDQAKAVPVLEDVSHSYLQPTESVQWSPSGEYMLLNNQWIVSAKDGDLIHKLEGSAATWSPVHDAILYVPFSDGKAPYGNGDNGQPVPLGNSLVLWDMKTASATTLHRASEDEPILGKPVWDSTGRYFSFPTGRELDGEWFFAQVHVMDGRRFHYMENEQNVAPTKLTHLTLSPGGEYLSYSVNGVLKLINLNTQESRVYDHSFADDGPYRTSVRFDPDGVWLARDHEVVFVAENMEEKIVYQTSRKLLGFYLSSSADRLLVMEEMADGQRLRLINLHSGRNPGHS
ncbi:hypothetical protein [Desmospora profundinema]|uniref:WD40 repeat domain-containing protein n=1 Tax=Desmospora profundinema TaxID=1571184 RepID=A0ABU1IM26_9BACL|nr:hypothetical protein [Desmospora profundinema]MDR6225825.1 hypothetical protein [Desmospora profundinema]